VLLERDRERREAAQEGASLGRGKRRDDPDMTQGARIVVEAEEQRRDGIGRRQQASPGDDAVGRPGALDLAHRTTTWLVRRVERLGDDPVHPRAGRVGEPVPGDPRVQGPRRDRDRAGSRVQEPLQPAPPLGVRAVEQGPIVLGEQVECDVRGRQLRPQASDAARRRMEARHQRREVEAAEQRRDDLAVEDEGRRGNREERLDELRKVPRERTIVPAPEVDAPIVTERETPKAVPLRLVREPVLGDRRDELREHGRPGSGLQVRGEPVVVVARPTRASYDPRNPSQHLVRGSSESVSPAAGCRSPR
jgi:hypothetical protein